MTNKLGDALRNILNELYEHGYDDGSYEEIAYECDFSSQRDLLVDIAMKKVYNVLEGDSQSQMST
jgi:hypothetical protein